MAAAVAACACLGLAGGVAAEEPKLDIGWALASYGGTLCPEGSLGAPDHFPETIQFDVPLQGSVELGDAGASRSCRMVFDLTVPAGYQFSTVNLSLGAKSHHAGANSSVRITYGFEETAFGGPQSIWADSAGTANNYLTAQTQLREWSPSCKADKPVRLVVTVRGMVDKTIARLEKVDQPSAKLDLNYLSLQVDGPWNRGSWRRCDGKPMPEIAQPNER